MKKSLKMLYWMGFGLGASLVTSGVVLMFNPVYLHAAPPPAPVPGNLLAGKSLNSLGAFTKDGSVQLPPQAAEYLGGLTTITWKKGQKPSEILPIAMWDTAFKAGALTPAQINPSLNMDNMRLGQYLEKVSISELVRAMPDLANRSISEVKPIYDLINSQVAQGAQFPSIPDGSDSGSRNVSTLAELVQVPEWSGQKLGNVSSYSGKDIPGVSNTPLNNFESVRRQPATSVPGLANVKIEDMPGFNLPAGYAIVKPDVIRTREIVTRKVLSGSKNEPNAVCKKDTCNHLEVRGMINGTPIDGGQIVDGDTQEVSGGYGLLGNVNNGREPTGFLPYGDRIKEVYDNFDAKSGDVGRSWYFDYCQKIYLPFGAVIDLGCTPHFIGPIPIGTIHEGDGTPLLLGNINIPMTVSGQKLKSVASSAVGKVLSGGQKPAVQTAQQPYTPQSTNTAFSPAKMGQVVAKEFPTADMSQVNSIASSNIPLGTKAAQIVGGANSALGADTPSLLLGKSVGDAAQSLVQKYVQKV
jgi:hypothetical protein